MALTQSRCCRQCSGQLEIIKLCSAWISLFIPCRLGRVGTSQPEQQWIQTSPTPLSSTSTCAVMQAFRYRAAELAGVTLLFFFACCCRLHSFASVGALPGDTGTCSKLPLQQFGPAGARQRGRCVLWRALGFSPGAKDLSSENFLLWSGQFSSLSAGA